MKRWGYTPLLILFLLMVSGALGYNFVYQPFKGVVFGEIPTPIPTPTPTLSPQDLVNSRDKIARLLAVPVTIPSASVAALQNYPGTPQVITLFGTNITASQAAEATARIKAKYPGVLIAVDHEGGSVQRLSGQGFTVLPSWQKQRQQVEAAFVESLASSAAELQEAKVDFVFAPVVDLGVEKTSALNSRLCSNKSNTVVERSRLFASIMRSKNVTVVFKHFPGIGAVSKDLHTHFDTVTVGLVDEQVQSFKFLLDEFPTAGVMVAHVGVTNQDPSIPCSLSIHCVSQLTQKYPKTLVFTDALEMKSAGYQVFDKENASKSGELKPLAQRAEEALIAGNHILVFGPSIDVTELTALIDDLDRRYHESDLVKQAIDARYREVDGWVEARQKE